MPELLAAPHTDRPGTRKHKKKEEKVALVFQCTNDTEKRPRLSRYAQFFEGTTLADYLYQRKRERKVVEQLEAEEDTLLEEDPEQLAELRTLRESFRSEDLPYFSLHYHTDLLEEAAKTVPIEKPSEPGDTGEYFVLSEEDRLRLEAMFSEMSAAEGAVGEAVDDGTEVDEGEEDNDGSQVDDGSEVDKNDAGDEGDDGDGEEDLELERESEQDSNDDSASDIDGRSYDEDGFSEAGSVNQDIEAEADNGKPRGHFSRWEKDPKRQAQPNPNDKKEQKFKPRLNVVWQKRLENSKVKKDEPTAPAGGLPPPRTSLFNSIIPKKYRRKPKSRLPSIVVSNSRKDRPEPASVEIGKPRQNRSSELRLQKRLLQEAKARGSQPKRRQGDGGQRRLRRSQSHTNMAKEGATSMRRASSLRNLPSQVQAEAARQEDTSQVNTKEEAASDGQKRKGTPHPGRRAGSAHPSCAGDEEKVDSAAEEDPPEVGIVSSAVNSMNDVAGEQDIGVPPVSV